MVRKRRSITVSPVAVALVATALFGGGLVVANASSLGTLTVNSIGTASSVVATCDSDGMNIGYGGVSVPSGQTTHSYSQIVITGINNQCDQATYGVTIAQNSTVINTSAGTLTVAANSSTITLSGAGSPVPFGAANTIALYLTGP